MVKTEIRLVVDRMHILGYVNHFPCDFSFVLLRSLSFLWCSGYGVIVMGVGLVIGLVIGLALGGKRRQQRFLHRGISLVQFLRDFRVDWDGVVSISSS